MATTHAMDAADEERMVNEGHGAATNYYAGPFCGCGDYSCPANNNPHAQCVNQEYPGDCLYFDYDSEGNTIVI